MADVLVSGIQNHGVLWLVSPTFVAYFQDNDIHSHLGSEEGEVEEQLLLDLEELLLLDRDLAVIFDFRREANRTFLHVGTHPRGFVWIGRQRTPDGVLPLEVDLGIDALIKVDGVEPSVKITDNYEV